MFSKFQQFMMSYAGRVLINYLYAWGAAIAILGTLFKLIHLPYANLMLMIGLGTEVLIFFVSGFELPARPQALVDLKEKSLDEEYNDDELPNLLNAQQSSVAPSVVYVGGGNAGDNTQKASSANDNVEQQQGGSGIHIVGGGFSGGGAQVIPDMPVEEIEGATTSYLDRLKEMTETIGRINEGLSTFTTDPTQMESVNRHIAGLNAIFELQLRSASKQVDSVDKVREQTDKMAAQIEELNKVYARMLQAMTTNMAMNLPQQPQS